jgi:hypothetical protein
VTASPATLPALEGASAVVPLHVLDPLRRRFLTVLAGFLGACVVGIMALAFAVSFRNIASYGKPYMRGWEYALPFFVDAFIAVAAGIDLWFALSHDEGHTERTWRDYRREWAPKFFFAGMVGVSFLLNEAAAQVPLDARHAPALITHGLAPFALLVTHLLFMTLVRSIAANRNAAILAALDGVDPAGHSAEQAKPRDLTLREQRKVLAIRERHPNLPATRVAAQAGIAYDPVRAFLRDQRPTADPVMNGKGA